MVIGAFGRHCAKQSRNVPLKMGHIWGGTVVGTALLVGELKPVGSAAKPGECYLCTLDVYRMPHYVLRK